MLVVDIVVLIVLAVALVSGFTRGFFASLGVIVGMVAGALAALWLVPLATPAVSTVVPPGLWRSVALAALAVAIVLLAVGIGAGIGAVVRRGADRTRLRGVERFFGGVVSLLATTLVVTTLAAGLKTAGIPVVSAAVASSRVLTVIDDATPAPVADVVAQLRSLVIDDTVPRLAEVIGVTTPVTGPPIALDDPELQRAAQSVARISGTAYSCGRSMTGSGFVAADGLVVTNAHVVAGVDAPIVELPGGVAAEGRLVYLDPVDDLAVIAVRGLPTAPLALAAPAEPGTRAAVQGYPLGGPFTSGAAAVLSVGPVPVPDIYDQSVALREVYALDAEVRPGNSGGPLLDAEGEVIGVVFARGVDGDRRGYAMTSAEVRPALDGIDASSPTVASGRCTS